MLCWKCGAPVDVPKIGFRSICETCNSWLHCCRNCVNYRPGLPNDCAIPGTDPIADREANNFCDEFVVLGKGPGPKVDPKDVAKRLFKDEE